MQTNMKVSSGPRKNAVKQVSVTGQRECVLKAEKKER